MQIPLVDLKGQYAGVREEILAAVEGVVDSAAFCNGPPVRELEAQLAEYCQCKEAVGVSNGTDALLASLMALETGPGDEVITTPFTFFATAGSIARTGATPVFVDIEPDTFNIDPAQIEAAITDKTRAIIPVHLYGQMAEMDPIMAVARKHGVTVIEDAAQAIGATYQGRKACSIGEIGCLSFYPSKNLGAMGDAGMVLSSDSELAEKIRMLRNHGQGGTYVHKFVGGNFRMSSLCAVGVLVMLRRLDGWTDARTRHADLYNELFAGFERVTVPPVREGNRPVYYLYVIRVPRRDELQAFLNGQGIEARVYYPLCLHQQECFARLGYRAGDFPEAERAAREVLALPIIPELTDEQIRTVAGKVKDFLA